MVWKPLPLFQDANLMIFLRFTTFRHTICYINIKRFYCFIVKASFLIITYFDYDFKKGFRELLKSAIPY